TGQTISLSSTDSKAFAKTIDEEIERLKVDVKKDMNRQEYGDGTGAVGVVTGAAVGNVVPVSAARLFQRNMRVDITTLPSTVAVPNRIVTGVDLANNTLTVSGAAPRTVADQLVVRQGSFNKEITGFGAIVDDTSV